MDELRKMIGVMSQEIFPSFGHCRGCGVSWKLVEGKVIQVTKERGLFAVCESCWNDLRASELIKHYTKLYKSWADEEEFTLEDVIEAVKIEKQLK